MTRNAPAVTLLEATDHTPVLRSWTAVPDQFQSINPSGTGRGALPTWGFHIAYMRKTPPVSSFVYSGKSSNEGLSSVVLPLA